LPERTPPAAPSRPKRPAPPKARPKPAAPKTAAPKPAAAKPARTRTGAAAKPRTRAQIQADAKSRGRTKPAAEAHPPADGETARTAPEGRRVLSERVRKRRMLVKVGFAGLFLILFLFLFVFPTRTYLQQRDQKNAAEQHLQLLRQQTAMLKEQTRKLKTGPEIERIARAQFGLIRPGETPYVVVPTPTSTQPATSPTAAPQEQP
jgi:cell division protein FtsB